VDLEVELGGAAQAIGGFRTLSSTLVAGLLAWVALELLERCTSRAGVVWRSLACTVLVVSLTGPLAATSGAATAVLMGLHAVVGTVLIIGLGRSADLAQARRDGSAGGS
jgi:hypothetical protein